MRANDDGKTVAAMDVLVPGMGELIGGSQRRAPGCAAWSPRRGRFGPAPMAITLTFVALASHAGFGLIERLVCPVTGMTNIRDVIPHPRYPGMPRCLVAMGVAAGGWRLDRLCHQPS